MGTPRSGHPYRMGLLLFIVGLALLIGGVAVLLTGIIRGPRSWIVWGVVMIILGLILGPVVRDADDDAAGDAPPAVLVVLQAA